VSTVSLTNQIGEKCPLARHSKRGGGSLPTCGNDKYEEN